MWEIPVLGILFLLTFGVAIYMVTRTKRPEVTVVKHGDHVDTDVEELAVRIAKAVATEVAKEFIEKLGTVGYHGSKQSPDISDIQMDESIIPVNVTIDVGDINLDKMAKEKIQKDKGLEASKSKLASILKKKGKE